MKNCCRTGRSCCGRGEIKEREEGYEGVGQTSASQFLSRVLLFSFGTRRRSKVSSLVHGNSKAGYEERPFRDGLREPGTYPTGSRDTS